MPAAALGSIRARTPRSQVFRNAQTPTTSCTIRIGSRIAAACTGEMARVSRGARRPWAGPASEDRVAAVDDEAVAGVELRGVRGQVHRDAREVLALAPAAHRHPADGLLVEGVPRLQAGGHVGGDPARQDGVGPDAVA